VGLAGTSGWVDFMYMNQLNEHSHGKIVAVCGRNAENAQKLADKWKIPHVFTDYDIMIKSGLVDAVIISTPNDSHYPFTMAALEAGIHVLCEKPLAMNYTQAQEMAALAEKKGLKTLTPYTWSFMPNIRYLRNLIETGYIGKPYHCSLRWKMSFTRDKEYAWRLDAAKAGSGIVGDLGSHYIHMARQMFGEVKSVSCQLGYLGEHPSVNPDGKPYETTDDSATILVEFESGAQGVIHVTSVAYMGTPPGFSFDIEFHGSEGMVSTGIAFEKELTVYGGQEGEPLRELPIPDDFWAGASRETGSATIGDVYGKQEVLARAWVTAIAEDKPLQPDLREGAAIQRIIDAAVKSSKERRWVDVNEIQ
jgi:predicted dehydrogenase